MLKWLGIIFGTLTSALTQRDLAIENLALRQQVAVLKRIVARRSSLQDPYAVRVIGSIRHECLDHVVLLGLRHLKRIVFKYVDDYHGARTHLSLYKDARNRRPVQPLEQGRVIELKGVGGLHHRYVRLVA